MGKNKRGSNAKKNIVFSLFCQVITILCGLIVPRRMIATFGSEVNGAITSISTFLGYITLLEGGIGGVARAALYRPLAESDSDGINAVMVEIKSFFRRVGFFFGIYVIVIACTFKFISHTDVLDWDTLFWLVIISSASTFAQYFFGISNMVLLYAAQKEYINNLLNAFGILLNAIVVVAMTYQKYSLLAVRFVSGMVFTIKPILLWMITRRYFTLTPYKTDKKVLKDKWTGLGQHIAYFLHSHTDVVVLTIFGNLQAVSVYGVYYMVTSAIQKITTSFSAGMEAVFGDMYAKKERDKLDRVFSMYDTLISIISIITFGTTLVLIVPFVSIYTNDISDINYIEPLFGGLLTVACLIHCLRIPYHFIVIAAGHFKQTNTASYGEGIINIISSVVLVIKYGLVGVAIGTVIATLFRFVYYALYISKHIMQRNIRIWVKRETVNIFNIAAIYMIANSIISYLKINTYPEWMLSGLAVAFFSGLITIGCNIIFYKQECRDIYRQMFNH